jgi:anti-sigma28 factor (negative regulator of flagellin synthesis)
MKIQSGMGNSIEALRPQMESKAGSGVDATKQAGIAQATVKVVQEALAKAGAASSVAPSAQVSVDGAKIARLAGAEKTKDSDKLDTAKLDALKESIKDGSFEFDYGLIARQLVEAAAQQKGSRRG